MKLYRCSSGRVQPLVYPAEQFLQMINKANGLALEVCHDVGYSRASPPTSASSKIPLPKSSIVTAWKKPKLAGCCKTAADPVTCWRRVAAQPKTEEIVREYPPLAVEDVRAAVACAAALAREEELVPLR